MPGPSRSGVCLCLQQQYTGPADKSSLRSRLLSQVRAPFVFPRREVAQLRRLRNCGSTGSKENVTGKKEERAAFFDPPIHLSKSPSEHQGGGLSPLLWSALTSLGRASYSPNPSKSGRASCSQTPKRFFLCQKLFVGPGGGNIWLSVNVWAQLRTETKTKTKLSVTC